MAHRAATLSTTARPAASAQAPRATRPAPRSRSALVRAAEADAPVSLGSDPSKLTTSLPSVLGIDEIMERLPHRFPFLLVRRLDIPPRLRAELKLG